jgi:folylpolyglutamate synthase/dihydrofolate synthase
MFPFSLCSPHIRSICERIRVDCLDISEKGLDQVIDEWKDSVESCQRHLEKEGDALSHFEILTGVAFRHFKNSNVDIAIVEAGLGGARDATNVIQDLDLAVITPVGYEHADALGGSIESIAKAKSGIMKENKITVIGRQPDSQAEAILLHEASLMQSPSFRSEALVQYHVENVETGPDAPNISQNVLFQIPTEVANSVFEHNDHEHLELDVNLQLVGEHQASNAATAITVSMALRKESGYNHITVETIKRGLESAVIPGRFQILESTLIQGKPVVTIADGAHTPDSAKCVARTIRSIFPDSQVALVIAMASDKDHKGFCEEIQKIKPCAVIFTDALIAGGTSRSAGPGVLVGAWQLAKMNNRMPGWRCRELIQASVKSAIVKAKHELSGELGPANGPRVVLVCGSLHAAGAALETETVGIVE